MAVTLVPPRRSRALPAALQQKGRGAKSNAAGRFEAQTVEPFDDGWSQEDPPARTIKTTLIKDSSRTIISRNDSPDIGFDQSINPYRGCEHGCVYCYARPSHAYWGYSAGLDFESVIFFKPNAIELLAAAFEKPRYQVKPIMIGANTDPYQPAERRLRITRGLLETCLKYRHPISVITKSAAIVRDVDVLGELAALGLVRAAISVTTLDRALARAMEPRAATPLRRFEAIEALAGAGVSVRIMTAPIIPGLNDWEIERLLEAGSKAGARAAGYVLLRLPLEIKDLFKEWLAVERPAAAKKILSLIRQTRGGSEYDATFFKRGRGEGPVADMIAARFEKAARALGLEGERAPLRTDLFQRPRAADPQLSLF